MQNSSAQQVENIVWQSLDWYSFKDAVFLAERLYAEEPNENNVFLLASVYFRNGELRKCLELMEKSSHSTPRLRLLQAKSCLQLNLVHEAELCFRPCSLSGEISVEQLIEEYGDAAPFALQTLGTIYSRTERRERGIACFKRSLQLNPFLFHSFEQLCTSGANPSPADLLRVDPSSVRCSVEPATRDRPAGALRSLQFSAIEQFESVATPAGTPEVAQATCAPTRLEAKFVHSEGRSPLMATGHHARELGGPMEPPGAPRALRSTKKPTDFDDSGLFATRFVPLDTPSPTTLTPEAGSPRVKSSPASVTSIGRMTARPGTRSTKVVFSPASTNVVAKARSSPSTMATRRSARISSLAASKAVKENTARESHLDTAKVQGRGGAIGAIVKKARGRARTTLGSHNAEKEQQQHNHNHNHHLPRITPKPEKTDALELGDAGGAGAGAAVDDGGNKRASSAMGGSAESDLDAFLRHAIQPMALVVRLMNQYEFASAADVIRAMPDVQQKSPFARRHLAKCLYHQAKYQEAASVFNTLHHDSPSHLEFMDYYSTVLWHLNQSVELSTLAADLQEMDRAAPQTWCAMGNCFSLLKEHDTAIKFFERAIQLEPTSAYPYVLLGHELGLVEETEKALNCFRNALRYDARNAMAWSGLASMYLKQERLELAELHARRALQLFPTCAIMMDSLAKILLAAGRLEEALKVLDDALAIDPQSAPCKFDRAVVLDRLGRVDDALSELESLRSMAPSEALVFFLMGKLLRKRGDEERAHAHLAWALDLDPRGANGHLQQMLHQSHHANNSVDVDFLNLGTSFSESNNARNIED